MAWTYRCLKWPTLFWWQAYLLSLLSLQALWILFIFSPFKPLFLSITPSLLTQQKPHTCLSVTSVSLHFASFCLLTLILHAHFGKNNTFVPFINGLSNQTFRARTKKLIASTKITNLIPIYSGISNDSRNTTKEKKAQQMGSRNDTNTGLLFSMLRLPIPIAVETRPICVCCFCSRSHIFFAFCL